MRLIFAMINPHIKSTNSGVTHSGYRNIHTHNRFTAVWILSGTTRVSWHQKGKTRNVKPIWVYWSKRQWVAVVSAGPYANLHLDPDI